jgi:hypothetical protein
MRMVPEVTGTVGPMEGAVVKWHSSREAGRSLMPDTFSESVSGPFFTCTQCKRRQSPRLFLRESKPLPMVNIASGFPNYTERIGQKTWTVLYI